MVCIGIGPFTSKEDATMLKPNDPPLTKQDIARFWSKVNVRHPKQCWPWTGSTRNGYGRMMTQHGPVSAHRVAYFFFNDQWPTDRACHTCDNPTCCNPNHLFDGTQQENVADMIAKGRRVLRTAMAHPHAKLTPAEAIQIRDRNYRGEAYLALAQEYGVSKATIARVCTGEHWAVTDAQGIVHEVPKLD
jgi:hypothetical protein